MRIGNSPDNTWSIDTALTEPGGVVWTLFRRQLPGDQWSSYKLVASAPVTQKANYWFGYNTKTHVSNRRSELPLLKEYRPALYEVLADHLKKVHSITIPNVNTGQRKQVVILDGPCKSLAEGLFKYRLSEIAVATKLSQQTIAGFRNSSVKNPHKKTKDVLERFLREREQLVECAVKDCDTATPSCGADVPDWLRTDV